MRKISALGIPEVFQNSAEAYCGYLMMQTRRLRNLDQDSWATIDWLCARSTRGRVNLGQCSVFQSTHPTGGAKCLSSD